MARPSKADVDQDVGGGRADMQAEKKKFIIFEHFETMDTQPARVALSPKRLAWCENILILAQNDLLAVPGLGDVLATLTGETITERFYAFVAGVDYLICFTASGSGYAVNVGTGAKTHFAPAATFSENPDMTQWKDERILIIDPTAGYCTWDGTLFVVEGQISPNFVIGGGGVGYVSAPTVTITGGTGAGQAATATITDGSVTALTLTNAGTGFVVGDTNNILVKFSGGTPDPGGVVGATILNGGFNYYHTPTVTIAAPAGGGTTATATAAVSLGAVSTITITVNGTGYAETPAITITPNVLDTNAFGAVVTPVMDTVAYATVNTWPFVIHGTTLAIFEGRVWIAKTRQLQYTGTTGYDDVDEGNAAGITILQDADLVHEIVALRSANNFLFIIGDQSVKQIGTVSVSGTITNFKITTLSSDQGTLQRDSVTSYNRLLSFTNRVGTYAVFGASLEKISSPMDGIIQRTDFSQQVVSDVFDFYSMHTLLSLVKYNDPQVGSRSLIMAFYDKRWSVISMGDTITGIVTAHLNGLERIFSTEGPTIREIIADTDTEVDVTIQTALTHNNEPVIGKGTIRCGIGQSSSVANTVNVTIDSENGTTPFSFQLGNTIQWVNNSNQIITWRNNSLQTIEWLSTGFVYYSTTAKQSGIFIGATVEGSFKGYHCNQIAIEYNHQTLFKSRNM